MATDNFTLRSLADQLAADLDTPKAKTFEACKAAFEAMAQHAISGGRVAIHAFGSFKMVEKKARTGRNPKTGEKIEIPAKMKLVFKAAKVVNEAAKPAKKAKKK